MHLEPNAASKTEVWISRIGALPKKNHDSYWSFLCCFNYLLGIYLTRGLSCEKVAGVDLANIHKQLDLRRSVDESDSGILYKLKYMQ